MRPIDTVRASRDGDQFHYVWASRQALKLLDATGDLELLHVEGVEADDTTRGAGDEVVDLAEYRGGASLRGARLVVYRQFKHSTNQASQTWTVSFLRKTVIGLAWKYRAAVGASAAGKVEFEVVTNRPADPRVHRALTIVAATDPAVETTESGYLRDLVSEILDARETREFYSRLRIDDRAPDLLALTGVFEREVRSFLPGSSGDEHLVLKDMVAVRASSLGGHHPDIARHDVLAALRTDEPSLLPAPDRFAPPSQVIETGQVADLAAGIVASRGRPCLVHAAGGIGKSVAARTLGQALPPGSVTVVYDCFGNGAYRRTSEPRHEAASAYVQLINEMAARTLCTPIVPSSTATTADYTRIFLRRLEAAAARVAAASPSGLLVIVIDAADNAEAAARERNGRSFVTDLLWEEVPDNVRLVAFCRSERRELLAAPVLRQELELRAFHIDESHRHVAGWFPAVSPADAAEIHAISGGNPRVQALICDASDDLPAALASLENATPGEGLLDDLLRRAVDQAMEVAFGDKDKLERLCTAIATLRPMIPIGVLARLADVAPAQISSFVADLGRPILLTNGVVQFRDEPTETWFQNRYRAEGQSLMEFLDRLRPLADEDPYVAASLPELLLQSGQVDELVALALSDNRLPHGRADGPSAADSELERRELAQQRTQLALRACLRQGRDKDGARLALRAGALTAGRSRRIALIKANVDLAAEFLDPQVLEHLIATRAFASTWPGSNLHVEGALQSGLPEMKDLARVRLRSAQSSMEAWVRQAADADERHDVGIEDIASLAWGHLNASGVDAGAVFLSRWSPASVGFEAGLVVARQLASARRLPELEGLIAHGHRSTELRWAVAQACYEADLALSTPALRRLLDSVRRRRTPLNLTHRDFFADEYNDGLDGIVWAIAVGLARGVVGRPVAERTLRVQIGDGPVVSTSARSRTATAGATRGAALLAKLADEPFDPIRLARPELVRELRGHAHTITQEGRRFRSNVVALGPWVELWSDVAIGQETPVSERLAELMHQSWSNLDRRELPHQLLAESVPLAARLIATHAQDLANSLVLFVEQHPSMLPTTTLTAVVRSLAPHPSLHPAAVRVAETARAEIQRRHQDAFETSEAIVALARAVYPFDSEEAREYFRDAVDVTDAIGDDAYARWGALLALARTSAADRPAAARRAFRLCEIAEHVEPYLGDRPNTVAVLGVAAQGDRPTSIAFASRWRDRRFAPFTELALALVADADSALGSDAASLVAFVPLCHLDPVLALARAIRAHPSRGGVLVDALATFDHDPRHHESSYRVLDEAAATSGVDLDTTAYARSRRRYWPTSPSHAAPAHLRWGEPDVAAPATTPDLRSPDGWAEAFDLADRRPAPFSRTHVVRTAAAGPLAELARVLESLADTPSAHLHDLVEMLRELDGLVVPRAASIKRSRIAAVITSRFAREIAMRPYDIVDLDELARLCGAPDADYLGDALVHLGETSEPISAEQAFALAVKLSQRIPAADAGLVFDDCSALFDGVVPEARPDGPFASFPAVPSSIARCRAAFLWAALGDVSADVRWRAAHAVRVVLAGGDPEDWSALHELASGTTSSSAFTSADFHFYDRHALTWLLLALARAATDPECGQGVRTFLGLLRSVCLEGEPHVVMQSAARQALLLLHRAELIDLGSELERVKHLGVPVEPREGTRYPATVVEPASTLITLDEAAVADLPAVRWPTAHHDREHTRFNFFFDFTDHWCRDLGEAFGLAAQTIERFTEEVIADHWRSPYRGDAAEDARRTAGVYGDGTYVHKSSWPAEEDLDFYLAVHALYVVAGHVVRRLPPYRYADVGMDEYTRWLLRHVPQRPDGRWLADRRDSPPPHGRLAEDEGTTSSPDPDAWVFALVSSDLEHLLTDEDGAVVVWGAWSDRTYWRHQTCTVRSALVPPELSSSLLVALQTSPTTLWLPLRDPDAETPPSSEFQLEEWLNDPGDGPEGADSRDPHAASVRFPPPRPTDATIGQLGLSADPDMRVWSRPLDGAVLTSRVWSDEDHDGRGTSGSRLSITAGALTEFVARSDRDLVVEVQVRRDVDHRYGRRRDGDERFTYYEPSAKYYLVDRSGRWSEYP